MIIDSTGLFSSAQVETADAVSDNSIDLATYGDTNFNNWGQGLRPRGFLNISVAFDVITVLDVEWIDDGDPALGSPVVLSVGRRLIGAPAGAAGLYDLGVVPPTTQRYLGLGFNFTGTPTVGTITAGICWDFPATHKVA